MRIILVTLLLFLISCKDNTIHGTTEERKQRVTKQGTVSTGSIFLLKYNDKKLRDSLIIMVRHGDKKAFKELKDMYFFTEHISDFLFISLEMSDKYNYSNAYMTNYMILEDSYSVNMKNLGFYYLLKAYESGDDSAKEILKSDYAGLIITPSSEYWKDHINIGK